MGSRNRLLIFLLAAAAVVAVDGTVAPAAFLAHQRHTSDPAPTALVVGAFVAIAIAIPQLVGLVLYVRPRVREARELRHAARAVQRLLDEEPVDTAFQPVVDLASGVVIGVEALTRFTLQPQRSPDRWFADAVRAGKGLDLELLALRVALHNARVLPGHLDIALNVSPGSLVSPALLPVLLDTPIDPHRLIVEITEHSAVEDYDALVAATERLAQHGIRVAVDDAGAGYASLRHVVMLAPHIIKVDRDLVAGIDHDVSRWGVVAAILHFASGVGTRVVAEGVESNDELDALRRLGVHAGQGYLLGHPTTERQVWATWRPQTMGISSTPQPS